MQARTKVRVICTRPYHALFMHNMLIRPTTAERAAFGDPDFTIFNAGACPADPYVEGVSSRTSVAINIEAGEMVILGTEYAGGAILALAALRHIWSVWPACLVQDPAASSMDSRAQWACLFSSSAWFRLSILRH